MASAMEWPDYRALLFAALRELRDDAPHSKQMVKLVSAILGEFAFDLTPPEGTVFESEAGAGRKEGLDIGGLGKVVPQDVEGSDFRGEVKGVYLEVTCKLLPALRKILCEKNRNRIQEGKKIMQGHIRPAIALAIVHLLKKLPKEILTIQLPYVIGVIVDGLRNREQSERDAVRRALADTITALGPYYLTFVMYEVRQALRTGGYQQHVAGYTMFAILDAIQPQLQGDSLLPAMPLILQVCNSPYYQPTNKQTPQPTNQPTNKQTNKQTKQMQTPACSTTSHRYPNKQYLGRVWFFTRPVPQISHQIWESKLRYYSGH